MAFTGAGANKSKDDAAKRALDAAKIILISVLSFFSFSPSGILYNIRMAWKHDQDVIWRWTGTACVALS